MINAKTKDARILFVDDQEANVAVLENLLEREGYTRLLGITDPRQTYKAYLEFSPDLIILDLLMPNMNGFEVLEQLRPAIPADTYLPILILTADITPEARARALSGGAKDFITKPIDILEVSLRIRNLLETRFLHLQIQNRSQILNEMVVERTTELTRANEDLTHANRKLQTEIAERKRAETRAQHEKARAEALLKTASSLNNQLNLEAVLSTVCEAAAQALNMQGATVYLYNPVQETLEFAAAHGFPPNYALMVKPIPRALYEQMTSQTPYLEDIHYVPEAYEYLPIETLNICTVSGVNLIRGDQLIG
ncbi:MAG TPA: response regulator, partial [Anaerolineales bacterium]|nr:response regulator [Anaerolineales bacterium]